MASTYAHYKFGNEIIKNLKDEVQDILIKNIDIYNIGLHGPDIFFYYNPLISNKINTIGYMAHQKEAEDFIKKARYIINEKENKEAYIAYTLGFICHFALDSNVHSYIEYKIRTSEATHTEIESELDKELLIRDSENPFSKNLAEHIRWKDAYCDVISAFWDEVEAEHVKKALKTMYKDNKLLVCNSNIKRMFLKSVMALSGNYKEMHGQIISKNKLESYCESTDDLCIMFENSKKLAILLIEDFCDKLYVDVDFHDRFKKHFSFYEEEIQEYKRNENF